MPTLRIGLVVASALSITAMLGCSDKKHYDVIRLSKVMNAVLVSDTEAESAEKLSEIAKEVCYRREHCVALFWRESDAKHLPQSLPMSEASLKVQIGHFNARTSVLHVCDASGC